MRNRLFLLLLMLLLANCHSAEKKQNDKTKATCQENKVHAEKIVLHHITMVDPPNAFNEKGEKDGSWMEEDIAHKHKTRYYKHYKDGVLDGPYIMTTGENNRISSIGEFSNGEFSGIWYNFGDHGELLYIEKDFQKNDKPTPKVWRAKGICPYSCYVIIFHPNGNKESEGVCLWDESPDLDAYLYGKWIYYDESGKVIKTKIFE